MQLKFKKICLFSTVLVYFATFLIQSNFLFFQTWAQEKTSRVNIVAILVDSELYKNDNFVKSLKWYATDYVQQQLSDTKALVIPLNLQNIHAYDIYRMMENVYFDGLKNVNSSLIGVILVGNIPLPVVNQNGYIFPTIYPYVDFENQKYVRDSQTEYFVPNDNPSGQAEIWHGLISYGNDIQKYLDFFEKIKRYKENPNNFIGDGIWYDDFVAQKEGFLDENFGYYRNRIMFAEDLGYQRYSPLMKKMFEGEKVNDAINIVSELEKATNVSFGGEDLSLNLTNQGNESMYTTKMVQQEIDTSFVSDYNDLFSQLSSSAMRENIFAGGRRIKEYMNKQGEKSMIVNADTSSSKIQLKDEILLGNNEMQGLIENLNDLMENMIDKKIYDKKLSMDIVLPLSYKEVTKKRITFKCTSLVNRYENYYFGNNARLIDSAEDLSIYRGTYRNLLDLSGVTYSSLLEGKNAIKSAYDTTNIKLKSIGGSYDIFSNQVEGNRGYSMMSVEGDLDIYDQNKTQKNTKTKHKSLFGRVKKRTWPESCSDDSKKSQCELLYDFAKRWWGGASSINLISDSVSQGRYVLNNYLATDSWRPIFQMDGFQSLQMGDDEGSSGTQRKYGTGGGPQWDATSFNAYKKYASPTQREGWNTFRWALIGKGYEIYENHTPDVHIDFKNINYRDLDPNIVKIGSSLWSFSNTVGKMFNVSRKQGGCGGGGSEEYSYKVISSIVKHKSTTEDQINGIDRDKYGDNGTLGKYYSDVKTEYENLQDDLDNVLKNLSGLVLAVNSGTEYISGKFIELQSGRNELFDLSGNLFDKEEELLNLRSQLVLNPGSENIRESILKIEEQINSLKLQIEDSEKNIKVVLEEILEYVKNEKLQVAEVYRSIVGLYLENIFGALEFIAYLEGGNPDDYYGSGSMNLVKVGFLPSWISDINSIVGDVRSSEDKIVYDYEEIYSLIQKQVEIWSSLTGSLVDLSDEDNEIVDVISDEMDKIFVVEQEEEELDENDLSELEDFDEDEDPVDLGPIVLSGSTARESMKVFDESLDTLSLYFSNLIEVDKTGPAIVKLARSDPDFIGWLRTNSINFSKFSDVDWINEYGKWAKGPGYDKNGPRENHDLLVGVSEHMSGINILTPDRPIDSPRYISMQSIAGNEMKFIYPDLFKVEVYEVKGKNGQGYDIHQLLSPGEIKKNLIKYLNGKVNEYNSIIKKECDNALKMDDYFFRLSGLGYKDATPDLNIHSCNNPFKYEDFVDSIGGEKMLDTVSEVLYYQSLTNKTKLGTGNVAEDIELIKESFSLNDKREKVIEDYLVAGNEKTKNSIFEIPTYKVSGYEVAFVNSDGRDYIFPSDQISGGESRFVDLTSYNSRTNRNLTPQEKNFEDECGIPSNGLLPLFKMDGSSPWLKGFKCWLKETLKNPVKIKLKFDSSLGELLLADSLGDYIKNSELVESFENWGRSVDKYGEEWKSVFSPDKQYDSDKHITQLQIDADKHNQDVTKKDNSISRSLSKVYDNIRIKTTNLLLSDSNPSSTLRIESMADLNISITFKGTGDGCIKLNSTELCNGNSFTVKNFNPKTNPFSGLVVSSDHVAGKVGLVLQIDVGGGYIEHVVKYTVSPSVLKGFRVNVGDNRKLAGMLSPISLVGYDKYNNVVSWGLQKYTFSVSKGRFFKDGIYQQSFTTNDLRNLNFYYQAPSDLPDGSNVIIQIKTGVNNVISEYNMTVVQGNPIIKLNGKDISKKGGVEIYKLTSDENIYTGGNLDFSKLQKLNIDIYDLKGKVIDVDGQIHVSSKNGLFVLGTVNGQGNGKAAFYGSSSVSMKGGHATIYFYPSTIAGDDSINIEIPGLDTRTVDFKVYPAETSNIRLNINDDYVEYGGQTDFEIFTTDIWGNPTDASLYLDYDSEKVEFPDLKTLNDGKDLVVVSGGYLKTKIRGVGAGLTKVKAGVSSSIEFKVDKHIFPESGLNVMYLNYFGNDWGNQWGYFSKNNKYIESVMSKSDKIITTTTQLVSEDKIKKTVWKINPGFRITNFDNIDTRLRIGKSKIYLNIGGFSDMYVDMPNLKWMNAASLDTIYTLEGNKNSTLDDYAFFIPNKSSYKVTDGILYDDGEYLASIVDGEVELQLESGLLKGGENLWGVVYKGVNYGNLIIHYSSFVPNIKDFKVLSNFYLVDKVFTNGTTDNMYSVGVFDGLSDFELDTSYKSIQDSNDVDERIGFIGDFKNITLFGEGEIVGEATKKFGSELLINLGDPVLSRKGVNEKVYGTNYDGGIGKEIYEDSEKDIFGVYQIDFDGNGLKDWLFAYLDGTLKLAKNYGGSPDLRNMQELLHIAVHIKNVFVGDVDGDKYEDILVFTDNNQIRVYLNEKGKFDVDGRVVCLNHSVFEGEKSSIPSNLEGLNQFFVEDMDLDGKVDIVTYDKMGYIKVFYGGSTGNEPNYLSTQRYACDPGWYDRQFKNTTIVTALGIQISNDDIFDNSMIHWAGLSGGEITITESELLDYGVNFDPNSLENLIKQKERNSDGSIADVTKTIMDADNFDIKKASHSFISQSAKFLDVTLYENTLLGSTGSNYVFVPSSFLDPKNPDDYCSVWKNYKVKKGGKILMDGDVVSVRVTVKASDKHSCIGAFGDVIQGPRNVYYDKNNIIKGIRFLQNQKNAELKKKDGKFSYMIDNIELSPGEKMIFEYDLEYHQLPLKKMSITYDTFWSDDKYPDIKLQSIDGCIKDFSGFVNTVDGKRKFLAKNIPLQELIDKEYIGEDENTEDFAENISDYSDINQLPGILSDRINRIKLLGEKSLNISDDENGRLNLKNALYKNLEDLNMTFSVDLSIFEEQTEAIDDIIDTMMKGMCNGFSFGGSSNCKGLPVPFNQAFLAPGKYHLFGCWQLPMGPLENGLPVFFFPGNLPTPFGIDLPVPNALKGPLDQFLWVPGGHTWSSFIRIYAAPTLTAQLGIAICMSPDRIWRNVPSPLSDIAGNCVVFAVKPQCKNGNSGENGKDKNNPNEVYNQIVDDVKDSGICLQSQKGPQVTDKGGRSSPFNLYSYTSNYHGETSGDPFAGARNWLNQNVDVNGGLNYDVDISTSFLGIIELEVDSYIGLDEDSTNDKNSIFIGDIDVLGGTFSVNKIKGGIRQGIRSLLIDNWLDPQIRYIANHLTKMHVNVRLPDVSNLIDNEVQTMENVSENFSKIRSNDDKENGVSKISDWSSINYANLKSLNKSISNPFESLASLMNESNIINISTEQITVKIPMIFAEDIDAYNLYLNQRLEVNKRIINDWKTLLESFVTRCSSIENVEEREICYTNSRNNLNSFIEFENGDWKTLQNQIYTNLMILQEYRNFPFEIYEWIHVIDRYMSEISSLVSNTIGYLSYWTSTNSQRFVGYVDAIVLILNIIKTYQVIIDFSTEWGQNCGTCARDTYDQYSCKLSFLCNMIQLPIIQIPNFRLPNVTIDLTQIDLSLDIILPEFNFQPVKINLPDLPNLPEPPSISLNVDFGFNFKLFDLPTIPLLPSPPELPELPSFIPEVELELPILPPAPELPKLPNEIETIIDFSKIIGKIYCIVKGKFGLVGESSVKAKIEQLTQRTYEVKWIDNIMDFTNFSVAPIHSYGVDYEISSDVDLQFNFSDFYNYLDTLTKSINNLTTSSVDWLNDGIDNAVPNEYLQELSDEVDGAKIDVNVRIGKSDFSSIKNLDVKGLESDEIQYVDYDSAKSRLKEVLGYMGNKTKDTTLGDNVESSIQRIENQISRKSKIESNVAGLEKVKNDVIDYLDMEKEKYSDLENLINTDYEGFLAMVDSQYVEYSGKSTVDTGKILTYNTKLFNIDSFTKDSIESVSKSNPYGVLLDNKKTIIDGYWNAVNSNSANDLGLTQQQYLVLHDSIGTIKNQVSTFYSVIKPISSTELIAKNSRISTNKSLVSANSSSRLGSNLEVADAVDPSALSKGIYSKIQDGPDKGKLTKVVYSDSFVDNIGNRYYYNRPYSQDIILWDDSAVYLKCFDQECSKIGSTYKSFYHSDVVDEIPNQENFLSFDSDTQLKISDVNEEVKNRKVMGQTYDTLSFSWRLDDVDGYLIKLVDRIDYSYEKIDQTLAKQVLYVLALPRGTDLDDLYSRDIKLELLRGTQKIKSIYGNGDLVQIVYYDEDKDFADAILSDVDRKWYYARIATLNLENDIYKIDSPWSNQIVLGKQMVGDDQPPFSNPILYRKSTSEVVGEGYDLEGYVGTKYELKVNWKDNVSLSYINLSKNGKILDEKFVTSPEDTIGTTIDIHTTQEKEEYNILGIDQYGNRSEKTITIHYSIPDISIADISRNSDGQTVSITAELSQDIDQGNVSFQRKRGTLRKTIKTKNGISSLKLAPGQKRVIGTPYSAGNEIAMYDKNGKVMALMNPNTAEIKINSGYENILDVRAKVQDSSVLQIYNKNTMNSVFSLSIPAESCLKIDAENYSITDLPQQGKMGIFNGGKTIHKDGINILFISPTCRLYSDIGLEGTYGYDRELDAVVLTLYYVNDYLHKNPIKVWMKIKPFSGG